MAMTVVNNSSAMMTLGELNKNVSTLGKQLKKVATGTKITGAGDDTSGYAISERMQARIRSLNQDESNTKTGMSMLKVASGGIESIIEELRSLKELAINAANDSNTSQDRVTIQKEFDQRRENIDNIAVETNYNGKILLTGIYGNQSVDYIEPFIGPTGRVIHSGAVEPTGTPVNINTANYTITQSGVYKITMSSNITIESGVHDVKFVRGAGAVRNVHIVGPADGNANIWIEKLYIDNDDNSSFIKFQGTNNFLNFVGTNVIEINRNENQYSAVIHVGGGLTVEGGLDGTGSIKFTTPGFSAAVIGSNTGEDNASPITVNSGTYTSVVPFDSRTGALIGAGSMANIGDITVNGGTFIDESRTGVTIGGGTGNYYTSWQPNAVILM